MKTEQTRSRRMPDPALAGVIVLTALQFFLWMHHFAPHIAAFTDYAARILTGHPDWRVVQARLLSPFILVHLFGVLPAPLPCFTAAFLTLCNVLFYYVAREITGARVALGCLAAYIAIWTALFFKLSFTFDLIEMCVLVWFFHAAMAGDPARNFDTTVICLFLIQILNRESALFLAAYLGFCGVLRLTFHDRRQFAWREIGWGCGLFGFGATLVEYLRKTLFIIGPAARAGPDLQHLHFENFVIYQRNWSFFFYDLHSGWSRAKAPLFLIVLLLLHSGLLLRGLLRRNAQQSAYGLTMLLYSIAVFFSAILEETRVMQILVPNVVLSVAWLAHRGSRPSDA